MKCALFALAASSAAACSQSQLAVEANIVEPMAATDGYVWFEGNALSRQAHYPDCNDLSVQADPSNKCHVQKEDGGVTFDFLVTESGTYTFQAEIISPSGLDNSFYVATTLDNAAPVRWSTPKDAFTWTFEDIPSTKDAYFSEGTHRITLQPREDGTKVRTLRVKPSQTSESICFGPCFQQQFAVEANIVEPMAATDGYVWFEGNALSRQAHYPDCNDLSVQADPSNKCHVQKEDGGVTFDFLVTESGTYTFQAEIISPSGLDNSFYVATTLDNAAPVRWSTPKDAFTWTFEDIPSTKDAYFSEGTHRITLQPREDGTKVRRLRVKPSQTGESICFQPKPEPVQCATCIWTGSKIQVTHFTNSEEPTNPRKEGLQHKCYHVGSVCKCKCNDSEITTEYREGEALNGRITPTGPAYGTPGLNWGSL